MRPRAIGIVALFVARLALGCSTEQTVFTPHATLSRMQQQPRFDPFESSPFFSDGRTMRTPPVGTVPRERVVAPRERVSGLAGSAYVTNVPRPITRGLLAEGRARFDEVCANCHGVLGDGHSAVAENMQLRRPPSLHEQRLRDAPTGRLFQVITDGYGLMPAHAPYLTVDERWAIVAYVRALQLSQNANVAALPASMQRELASEAP